MTNHVLVGGGAFAREILDWFSDALAAEGHAFTGFLQDGDDLDPLILDRLPHLGPVTADAVGADCLLVMAVGSPKAKALLAERVGGAERFATVRHPTSLISRSARVGRGLLMGPFTSISADAEVGDLVTINAYGSVGHDVRLGSCSTLSGYVDLTGRVKSGEGSFWGSGSRVLPGVTVGANTVIGAGAVVVRNVPDGATLFAAPARKL